MNIELFYLLGIVGVFVCLLSLRLVSMVYSLQRNRLTSWLCRKLVYPYLIRRFRALEPITRIKAIMAAGFLAGTAFCNTFGIQSLPELLQRSGQMSTMNLVPLFMSSRPAVVAQLLDVALSDVAGTHWLAAVTMMVQCTLHTYLAIHINGFHFKNKIHFYGHLSTLGLLGLCLVACLQKRMYEIFKRVHGILALLTALTVVLHTYHGLRSMAVVICAVALFLSMSFFQKARTIARNVLLAGRCTETQVIRRGDSIILKVTPSTMHHVKPYQWYNLWIPGLSTTACLQLHPFMVAWVDATSLYFLVRPERGLTYKLGRVPKKSARLRTWLDGPYGSSPPLGDYPNVLLVASGIGIAAHLIALRTFVSGFKDHSIRTKSITLYWILDDELDQNLATEWLDEILQADAGHFKCRMLLFQPDTSRRPSEEWGQHKSVQKFYGKLQFEERLADDVREASGNTLLCVCAKPVVEDFARQISTTYHPGVPHISFVRADFKV